MQRRVFLYNPPQLLADFKQAYPELVKEPSKTLLQLIDFESVITDLTHE
ncbi:MAG: hypothetical protein ACTS78_03845 [Arsenophonus sp. NC-WZS1-MAG3]